MTMAVEILVPDLGESIIDATVAKWLKNEGEQVSVGEALVELETDKVDLEVGAPQDGVLSKIEVQVGQDVKVGQVLGFVETVSDGGQSQPQTPGEDTSTEEPERVESPEVEKEEIEGPAPRQEGNESLEVERATPVARRLAEERGIDLSQLSAAAGRRITREDVERHIRTIGVTESADGDKQTTGQPAEPEETARVAESLPAAGGVTAPTRATHEERREERIRMTRRRRTIAQRLVEAQQTAAMLTTFNDANMSAVMELRRRRREAFEEKYKVKLGIMSFFVKATISALKDFPMLNAEIQGEEILLKHYYDIGIAIGAEEGLVVPVLRNADQMTFAEIERAINALVQKSREGSLSIDDLRGGTFSITNGGVYGSLLSTPILNPPQSGILGMHRIEERPVAVDGEVRIQPMMYLALSYDHRIVDGREAVLFLARVKEMVEDPEALLLEG
jgi:2-oxoglutarate dehydrogenase E2 component (dihydrolipoamide succinyltransferase)